MEVTREKVFNKNNRIDNLVNMFEKNNMSCNPGQLDSIIEFASIEASIRGFDIDYADLKEGILYILETLLNKEIPERYEYEIISSMALRHSIIPIQGYSLVSKDWIEPLSEWIGERKCLEIMAGKGTLSYALKEQGKSVIATDGYNWNQFNFNDLWTDIEKIDALDAIDKYGKDIDIIIMSWCYMDELGYQCLLKMREVNPNAIMIYIGEPYGGCTGSDSLHENMVLIPSREIDSINKIYPRWHGLHDRIFLIK